MSSTPAQRWSDPVETRRTCGSKRCWPCGRRSRRCVDRGRRGDHGAACGPRRERFVKRKLVRRYRPPPDRPPPPIEEIHPRNPTVPHLASHATARRIYRSGSGVRCGPPRLQSPRTWLLPWLVFGPSSVKSSKRARSRPAELGPIWATFGPNSPKLSRFRRCPARVGPNFDKTIMWNQEILESVQRPQMTAQSGRPPQL